MLVGSMLQSVDDVGLCSLPSTVNLPHPSVFLIMIGQQTWKPQKCFRCMFGGGEDGINVIIITIMGKWVSGS